MRSAITGAKRSYSPGNPLRDSNSSWTLPLNPGLRVCGERVFGHRRFEHAFFAIHQGHAHPEGPEISRCHNCYPMPIRR